MMLRSEFEIVADDAGLHKYRTPAERQKGAEHLAWDDIVSVRVFKKDLFSIDCICMAFETSRGEWIEVDEHMKGWDDLVKALPIYLKGAWEPDRWWKEVAFPPFQARTLEVYRKKGN